MNFIRDNHSDIIALMAILISFFSAWRANEISKNIANKSFQKDYFDEVFREFMLEKFPVDIMEKLEWQGDCVTEEIYQIEGILLQFLKKIQAYKYINQDFFLTVYEKTSIIEDCVYELGNLKESKELTQEKYEEIRYRIDSIAYELYSALMDVYVC